MWRSASLSCRTHKNLGGAAMDRTTLLVSVIVGLGTGVLSSLLFWWLLHTMRPRLEWCPTIGKYRYKGGVRYQVKLRNPSRRVAIQIEVHFRLRIPDLARAGTTETLKLYETTSTRLKAHTASRWTVRPELMPERTLQLS